MRIKRIVIEVGILRMMIIFAEFLSSSVNRYQFKLSQFLNNSELYRGTDTSWLSDCLSISPSVCFCPFIRPFLCLHICMSIYAYLCIHKSVYLLVYLLVHLSVYLHFSLLSVCMFVCLCIYISVYLSACVPVYVSACLSM